MNRSGWIALSLVSLVCLLPGLGARAQTITRGPFLQQVEPFRIVVVWETAEPADGLVEYGPNETYGSSAPSQAGATHHEVAIEDLEPSTTYHYRVVSGAAESPGGVFATAVSGDEPFRFVVYGDNRSDGGDHSGHEAVVPSLTAEAPDFLINTGDMVETGILDSLWDRFFEIEADLLRDTPLFPTFGNHEQWDVDGQKYRALFALPPDDDGAEHTWYRFRYGNSLFLVLNTHDTLIGTEMSEAQRAWAADALSAAAADPDVRHVFVTCHHGPYSSSRHGGAAKVRDFLEGLPDADRIDAVFSGHDHCYERWDADSGLSGFVTGGGGAPLYGQDDPNAPYSLFYFEGHHYLVVEVAGDWVRICPMKPDGSPVEPCLESGDPPPACEAPSDCPEAEGGACPGAWDCLEGFCTWICDQDDDGPAGCGCGTTPPPAAALALLIVLALAARRRGY